MLTHRCPWCGEKIPVKFFTPHDIISIMANQEEARKCPSCQRIYKTFLSNITIVFLISVFLTVRFALSFMSSDNVELFSDLTFLMISGIGLFYLFRIPYARDYGIKRFEKSNTLSFLIFLTAIIVIMFIDLRKLVVLYWGIFILTIICLFVYLVTEHYRAVSKEEAKYLTKSFAKVIIVWDSHKQGGLIAPKFRIMKGEIFPACFINTEQIPISNALCVVLENLKWIDSHHCSCTIKLVLDNISEQHLFIKDNRFYLYHNYQRIAQGTIL